MFKENNSATQPPLKIEGNMQDYKDKLKALKKRLEEGEDVANKRIKESKEETVKK